MAQKYRISEIHPGIFAEGSTIYDFDSYENLSDFLSFQQKHVAEQYESNLEQTIMQRNKLHKDKVPEWFIRKHGKGEKNLWWFSFYGVGIHMSLETIEYLLPSYSHDGQTYALSRMVRHVQFPEDFVRRHVEVLEPINHRLYSHQEFRDDFIVEMNFKGYLLGYFEYKAKNARKISSTVL